MSLFYKTVGEGNYQREQIKGINVGVAAVLILLVLWVAMLVIGPTYRVYSAGQSGKAELAQADYNRQIIVRQAQAKLDAASLEAEAAVAHAKGVQESNAIIAGGLGGPEGYLRFLYIQMLSEQSDKQIIYIPTEAGLPILEAGHR